MKHLLFIIAIVFLSSCKLPKNFHEIDPGKYYRTAQLSGSEFQKAIDRYGIKTIINLRGEGKGKIWYDAEKFIAEQNGIELVNIKMSAKRLPHREDLIKLLDTFRNAERPMLIHCQAGVDRTGEATAIYVQEYLGWSKEQSLEMLSFKYFHIPEFMPAKTYFIRELYEGEDWAREEYDPCEANYKHYKKGHHCDESGGSIDRELIPDEDS